MLPFHSYPRGDRKFQKNGKKIQKIKTYHYCFTASQNRFEKAEKERKKNNCFVLSYPTRNRKFQKNSKKNPKIKKYHYDFISRKNRLEKAKKERKLKLPDV